MLKYIVTCYDGSPVVSRHENVPALVSCGVGAREILDGYGVNVAGFLEPQMELEWFEPTPQPWVDQKPLTTHVCLNAA